MVEQNNSDVGDNILVHGDLNLTERRRLPSLLTDIVNELSDTFENEIKGKNQVFSKYRINDKISHNEILTYRSIINEYKIYHGHLERIYSLFESQGSPKKNNILRYLKRLYLKYRGELMNKHDLNELETAKKYSDEIIEEIFGLIKEEVINSSNLDAPIELIDTGLHIVIVDGFIRCKILEEPS